MNRLRVAALAVALSSTAFAGAPAAPADAQNNPQVAQRMEKRMRTGRIIAMAEALDLGPEDALRLEQVAKSFDARRQPIHEQLRAQAEILRQAANGDQAALAQVDQAIAKAMDLRSQLEAINRDMFTAIARQLTPQQRAKLALFIGGAHHRHGGFGPHGGPGGGFGGQGGFGQ